MNDTLNVIISLLFGAFGGVCIAMLLSHCNSLKFYLYGYSEATEQTMRMIVAGLNDPRAKLVYDTKDKGWGVNFHPLIFPGGISQFKATVITSGTIGGGGRCSFKTHLRAIKHYKDFLKNQFDQAQRELTASVDAGDKVIPIRRK